MSSVVASRNIRSYPNLWKLNIALYSKIVNVILYIKIQLRILADNYPDLFRCVLNAITKVLRREGQGEIRHNEE